MRYGQLRRLETLLGNPAIRSRLIAYIGEEDESDEGDGGETPPPPATGRTTPPPATPPAGDGHSDEDETARTNRIVQDRLKRKELAIAKQAGFNSLEEMTAAAKKQREADDANQTELQKRDRSLAQAQTQISELEQANRRLQLDLTLSRHLAQDHPALVGHEDWITPRLLQEITDEEWADDTSLTKRVKAVVKAYAEKVGTPSGDGQQQRRQPLGTGGGPDRSRGNGAQTPMQRQAQAVGEGYVRNIAGRLGGVRLPARSQG